MLPPQNRRANVPFDRPTDAEILAFLVIQNLLSPVIHILKFVKHSFHIQLCVRKQNVLETSVLLILHA